MVCCAVAIWMTVRQLTTYAKNEDSSSVKFKSFHAAKKNKYPDVSVCFSIQRDYQFNQSKIPKHVTSDDAVYQLLGYHPRYYPEGTLNLQSHDEWVKLLKGLSKNDSPSYGFQLLMHLLT